MDIIRDTRPEKRKKKLAWSAAGIGTLAIAVVGWQLLPSGAPTMDASIVWSDTVAHGTLIRQVRGPGTLVPEQMRWITALTAGRIEQILSLPGTDVSAGDLIMRLSNPDVDMQLLQAQQQLSAAHASLVQLRTNLRMQELQQRATAATVRADYLEAERTHRINQQLFDENPDLVARADLDRSRESVEALRLRLETEEASARAQVNRARSRYFPTVSASAAWSGFSRQIGNEEYLIAQAQGSVDRQRRSCEFDNALLAHLPGLPGLTADDCSNHVLTDQMRRQVLAANQTFPLDFTRQPLSLRLNVSFPVFQGFARQRSIAEAHADRRDAMHARRAEELRLRAAVTQSYDDLVTAYRALRIQERNLEVATEQLELARRRYALGAAPFLELLDAEDSMEQSERDHLAAVYDFHAAIWSLEAAVGRRLRPEDG